MKRDVKKPEKERKQAVPNHVQLVMRKGEGETGSRVAFVMCELSDKKASVADRTFDPIRFLVEGRTLDYDWYAEKLEDALTRSMAPVYGLEATHRIFTECRHARKQVKTFDLYETDDGYNRTTDTSVFRSFSRHVASETVSENELHARLASLELEKEKASLYLEQHLDTCSKCMHEDRSKAFECKNNACPIFFTRYKQRNTKETLQRRIDQIRSEFIKNLEF